MKTKIVLCFILSAFALCFASCGRTAEPEHAAHDEAIGTDMHHDEHDGHDEHESGNLISFSKQLQNNFGIRTEFAQKKWIHRTIRSIGEIKPAGTREAEVIAPFAGILMPDQKRGIVKPGDRVNKGDILAVLAPSTDEQSGYKLLSEYRLAKAEYDRVVRLEVLGAVAARRVQEAELDLEIKEARLRSALGGADPDSLDPAMIFHLRAPATGILADVHLRYGQRVDMGEHLFNLVDPAQVWVEAQLPVSESDRLANIKDAYFSIGGSNRIYRTADLDGKLITVGGLLDPQTRRIPVIFEIDNPDNLFKPGSYIQMVLREDLSREGLVVPQTAILDEDGSSVVIVRVGEEDFRKTAVNVGAQDESDVEIIHGLTESDPVVVEGAYKIRLAANKPSADAHAGHGH